MNSRMYPLRFLSGSLVISTYGYSDENFSDNFNIGIALRENSKFGLQRIKILYSKGNVYNYRGTDMVAHGKLFAFEHPNKKVLLEMIYSGENNAKFAIDVILNDEHYNKYKKSI